MLERRAILFAAHHFLFDVFDRKLQQYVEADLVNYNTMKFNEEFMRARVEDFKKPVAVLTLGELEAGFVVFMVPLALSIITFGLEWIQTLMDYTFALIIFETFFKMKK